MITLFKKQPTVEQIHAEFDSAEEKILQECDNILNELKIPTETQIERKASIMQELGFVNSETVKQADILKEKSKTIQNKLEITKTQAELIREFKVKYPNEKFITIDELERICEKYNLIHAPAINYIKDIPEKNVLEMANCKKLAIEDKSSVEVQLEGLKSNYLLELFNKKEPIFTEHDLTRIKNYNFARLLQYFKDGDDMWSYCAVKYGIDNKPGTDDPKYSQYHFKESIIIDKSGFFVAAPKSHFDLTGLNKKSKYGFFKVEVKEVKDPVVFEYCKNNICRIVTKWGTDDDQSYLDPALLNETLN
jgi:hypothetical protein